MTIELRTDHRQDVGVIRAGLADIPGILDVPHLHRVSNSDNRALLVEHFANLNRQTRVNWFNGLTSTDAAKAIVRDGWPEGAARAGQLAPQLAAIVPPPANIRRRVKWDETGTELNIDRALAGDFDRAWRNTGPHPTAPRVVSLACGFGGSWKRSPDELFWSGAQLIVATDLLEQAGYSVELRALFTFTPHKRTRAFGKRFTIDVTAKRAGEPLRADAIAAVFSHAGIFRSFGFGLIACCPFYTGQTFGHCIELSKPFTEAVTLGLTEPADMVIPYAYTQHDAAANIEHTLTRLHAYA